MEKVIVTYKKPNDEAAFLKHYNEIHTPLVLKVPGLKELRVTKVSGTPSGPSETFMIAEMIFANKDDFQKAMKSEENKACGKDVMSFAKELVSFTFASESTHRPL